MAVRIRMKKMGRRHRPFFRICAIDKRAPRDGKVIEELGHYDPLVKETDARAILKTERIDYWLGVGAQASEKVKVLIKKYGTGGSHLQQQKDALERLAIRPQAPEPVAVPIPRTKEPPAVEEVGAAEPSAAPAPSEESTVKNTTEEESGAESAKSSE